MTSRLWRPPPLGPGGRPFRGWRAVPLVLSLAAFAGNALILLADRAPGLLSRLSYRVDAGVHRAAGAAGVDVPGGSLNVPQSDFNVHVLIWAVATLLVGLAMWSWASLVMGSAFVLVTSVALELSQYFFTRSRTVQLQDVLGNVLGVVTGMCAVAAFALVWRRFLSTRPSARPR